ncbi:MAG: Ldh family oxidoreductase [Anaerolineae bacterium]|nr:Ldh family oxidoreductase [Anaerolineae bacterium]
MTIHVDRAALKAFTQEVFLTAGLAPDDAAIEAEVLVWANLRGVDSHGVLRIPSYLAAIEKGGMNPMPDIRVTTETPAMALVDGDLAFGPVVTTAAMKRAIAKAREVGIGWVLIRNTSHQGAMGYYTTMAVEEGMIGLATVSNLPNMAPYGARARGLHNTPISIGAPAGRHEPLLLDMASSVAAHGKISLAIDKGIDIPEGWALDKEGRATTSPAAVATLLPFGGYKGSDLAMMMECMTGLLVGNPAIAPKLTGDPAYARSQNSFVAAMNIATFTDLDGYKAHIDDLIDAIKGLPKAEGIEEILVPGEPEARVREERLRDGIPLPEGTVRNLCAAADQLGIAVPGWLTA